MKTYFHMVRQKISSKQFICKVQFWIENIKIWVRSPLFFPLRGKQERGGDNYIGHVPQEVFIERPRYFNKNNETSESTFGDSSRGL